MPCRARALVIASAVSATLLLPGAAHAAPAPWFFASRSHPGLLAARGAVLEPCEGQNDGEVIRIIIRTPDGDVAIWEMECDAGSGSWLRRQAPAARPVHWPRLGLPAPRPWAA
jgi:hypothetical protein